MLFLERAIIDHYIYTQCVCPPMEHSSCPHVPAILHNDEQALVHDQVLHNNNGNSNNLRQYMHAQYSRIDFQTP